MLPHGRAVRREAAGHDRRDVRDEPDDAERVDARASAIRRNAR